MSFQITTAFVEQYKGNVSLLVQQKGSRLRETVMEDAVVGKNGFAEQIGATAAVKRTTRHGDTPLISTPHDRRRWSLEDYEWADLIDKEDRVRMLIDPTSPYAMNAAFAMGRSMDDVIITALGGSAATGETGSTSVALPTAQKVAVDYVESGGAVNSGLTVAKLRRARKILIAGNVDPSEQFYCAVTASQIDDLLRTTEVTSSDYNSVKALVQGDVDTFMGFKFVHTEQLTTIAASTRGVYAYAKSAMFMAIGQDIVGRISERADKSYSTQVYYCMSLGAVRMEEAKVVQIACIES